MRTPYNQQPERLIRQSQRDADLYDLWLTAKKCLAVDTIQEAIDALNRIYGPAENKQQPSEYGKKE